MTQPYLKWILLLYSLLLLAPHAKASPFKPLINEQSQFMTVDQAFTFDFRQKNDQLDLSWHIRPGYYLYRQQLKIVPQQVKLGAFVIPEGLAHQDEFYGVTTIFKQQLILKIPLTQATDVSSISVSYQGCADAGFCYPPETRIIPLNAIHKLKPSTDTPSANRIEDMPAIAAITSPTALPFSPFWALLIGIGIAFTPCVLPMYPLISAIILGGEKQQSQRQILLLAALYVQGMALTYTLLGLIVAAAGLQFQAALQHPYVLFSLSVLFILLSLSMFGCYSLHLPSALQTRLVTWSNHQKGGSLAGVFIMGMLAGLICSPCTTAPLSAMLLYIAQSGNVLVGGGILYLYAIGMGIPLIIVTLFGNRLLPRNGRWMQYVKEACGFVILALPVLLLERVLDAHWGIRLWSLLAIAFFGWAFTLSLTIARGWGRVLQLLLLTVLLIVARPLQDWVFTTDPQQQATGNHLNFQKVENLSQLYNALEQAKGRRVMLDLYADWCITCKQFEKYTFSDPDVHQRLANTVLLQADITSNSHEQAAMLKKLHVLGLPTILFFDKQGCEIVGSRINGFMNANDFIIHIQNNLL